MTVETWLAGVDSAATFPPSTFIEYMWAYTNCVVTMFLCVFVCFFPQEQSRIHAHETVENQRKIRIGSEQSSFWKCSRSHPFLHHPETSNKGSRTFITPLPCSSADPLGFPETELPPPLPVDRGLWRSIVASTAQLHYESAGYCRGTIQALTLWNVNYGHSQYVRCCTTAFTKDTTSGFKKSLW